MFMSKNIEIPFGLGFRVFITLLLMLICFACKTVKTATNTAIRSDSIVITDKAVKVDEAKKLDQISTVRDQSKIVDVTSEIITEILWSVPDSIGGQYVVKRTTTVRTRNASKALDVTQQETTKTAQSKVGTSSDKTKSRTEHKADATGSTQTKVSTPGFISWGGILIVVAAFGFVYMLLKSKKFL